MKTASQKADVVRSTLQRARGCGRLQMGARGLEVLYQQGCLKLRLPRVVAGAPPEAVVINSSGGVTGGDRLALEVGLGAGSALSVASQTAERIYRATDGTAEIANRLEVGRDARLDWLPQETILFDGAALSRRLEVNMAENARLLAVETLVFGRAAMGERVQRLHLRDHWRVRRGGRLIWADSLRLDRPSTPERAGLCGVNALSTLLMVTPDVEAYLSPVRAILAKTEAVEAAASAWDGKLIVRLLSADAQKLRNALVPLLIELRGLALPRVWML